MKYLSGILLILLTGCASNKLSDFREPPKTLFEMPEVVRKGGHCQNKKLLSFPKSWVLMRFNLNQDGQPENINIIDQFPSSISSLCHKKSFLGWKFKLPENHQKEQSFEVLFQTKSRRI